MADEREFYYISEIMEQFGLTSGMIAQLGEPDIVRSNPHTGNGTAGLYHVDRINAWINTHQDEMSELFTARMRASERKDSIANHRKETGKAEFDDAIKDLQDHWKFLSRSRYYYVDGSSDWLKMMMLAERITELAQARCGDYITTNKKP